MIQEVCHATGNVMKQSRGPISNIKQDAEREFGEKHYPQPQRATVFLICYHDMQAKNITLDITWGPLFIFACTCMDLLIYYIGREGRQSFLRNIFCCHYKDPNLKIKRNKIFHLQIQRYNLKLLTFAGKRGDMPL